MARSPLERAVRLLSRGAATMAAVEVEYVRDGVATPVPAIPAGTIIDSTGVEGEELTGREFDWVIAADKLLINQGAKDEPRKGDRLRYKAEGETLYKVYEVLPREGDRHFAPLDPLGVAYTVYTLYKGTEP